MKKQSLKWNALFNTITQLSSMILPLITFPYVTRVLLEANYGKVSFGNSVISYFNILAALGIATYAIREGAAIREDRNKIDAFASELFSFNMVTTAISFVILFLLLALWKDKADYRLLIAIQSVTVLANTVGASWIFTIFEDYLFVAVRSILVQIVFIILTFLLVKTQEDYLLYAIIGVAGGVLNNVLNFFYAKKYVKLRLVPLTNFKKYIKPIMILFASSALITVYLSADITMLGIMRTDAEVGVYEVSVKIYTIIKSVLNAIITVTIPRFSFYLGTGDKKGYDALAKRTFETILIMTIPALTGLFMVSRNAIMIMSGETYLSGTPALQILSIALMFSVSANFFVNALLLTQKREKIILIGTVASAVVNVALNLFMIPLFGIYGAAVTTLLAELTITVISVIACRDVFSFKGVWKTFLSVLLGSLGIVAVCIFVNLLGLNLVWDTVLKIAGSAVVYIAVMLLLRGKYLLKMLKEKD